MADIIASGDWWRVEDDGTLYIYCVGDMPDYQAPEDYQGSEDFEPPWRLNKWAITSISIADSVTKIGYAAFYDCGNLTSVTIPNSVTSISNEAFYDCTSLTSVTIPNSVRYIHRLAFYCCENLTSVTIGSGVTFIGDSAFSECSSMTDIYYNGTEEQWNEIDIDYIFGNEPLTSATIHYSDAPQEPETPAEVTPETPAAPIAVPEITIGNIGNPLAAVASALNLLIRAFVQLRGRLANVPDNATANAGTITEVRMNGVSKGTSGVVDLGTVLTEHQDISGKVNVSAVGAANGVAELDVGGKVPSSQLPSYVDDVLEYASLSVFPATGETGKIYVAIDANVTYRWSGSAYIAIGSSLALGETSATAYRGDRGKAAYDHAQTVTGNPHGVTKTDVGLGNVDNTSDANKPVSTATQTALNGKVDKATGKGLSTNDFTDAYKTKLDSALTQHQDISGKVDKVTGKGLSTNDYTTAEKNAVATIGDKVDKVTGKGLSTEDYTTEEKSSLAAVKALLQNAVLYRTASGNPATFQDGAAENLQKLTVAFTPTQTGSGNPYPPGGGTNLLIPYCSASTAGVTGYVGTDGGIVMSGTTTGPFYSGGNQRWDGTYSTRLPAGTYTFSCRYTANVQCKFLWVTESDRYGQIHETNPLASGASYTIMFSEPVGAWFWFFNTSVGADVTGVGYAWLNAGSSALAYAPYSNVRPISGVSSVTVTRTDGNGGNAQSVTVSLVDGNNSPLTVYGGTLDVTNGTLAVTHRQLDIQPGEIHRNDAFPDSYFYYVDNPIPRYNAFSKNGSWFCNALKYRGDITTSANLNYGEFWLNTTDSNGATLVFAVNAETNTEEKAVAFINNTPLQIFGPLLNPVTYQLTPQQLAALAGSNIISANCGGVTVEYRADTSITL